MNDDQDEIYVMGVKCKSRFVVNEEALSRLPDGRKIKRAINDLQRALSLINECGFCIIADGFGGGSIGTVDDEKEGGKIRAIAILEGRFEGGDLDYCDETVQEIRKMVQVR